MGKIHLLDDPTINRIAAGEVVERPASVVKELLENSLDAGATRIDIRIQGGGKRFIQVRDDGCGMDRDDAVLSIERHATSKLEDDADLQEVRTLGFRGEALPSIAAVSRFILRTAAEDGAGTEIEIHSGRIHEIREGGFPRGTTIEVDRLFYNVPARRKFMRTDGTETAHIVRIVSRYALARPDVGFSLEQAGRKLVEASTACDPPTRVRQVLGGEAAERMIQFDTGPGPVRAHGFAGRPTHALAGRDRQHLFVNGRAVADRVMAHAVAEAYGNTIPRGRFPAVVLFLEVDGSLVDVNVHPQKTEVRFQQSSMIHERIRGGLRSALSDQGMVPRLDQLRPVVAEDRTERDVSPSPYSVFEPATGFPDRPSETAPPPVGARALAQYRDSYIVAQDREGLLVVDQHAAHERVIFEKFMAEADKNNVQVQRLLFPRMLELSPSEFVTLEAEHDEFRRLGFLIEPFGGTTVRLDAVPAHAAEADPEDLVHELLGDAAEVKSSATAAEGLRYRLVTTAACKAAIKINHPLDGAGMQALLNDLYQVENLTTCPHGRPALFRLTLDEIEKAFRRR
ncbi:MAG: DNA mismatch repair endonuclease MutL [Acidobacteria bacterium]|uniref:DNA mismatch repair protein MutL n=1 Tax=Candidatus Polarisedimenticola svalbardensis TaxID=2886004 RepID=A0A8J6XYL8_9BACT|nr:DNA mismatch repair endonuclease MutL [Candidatus Polarisedimenticola svalbardensis]